MVALDYPGDPGASVDGTARGERRGLFETAGNRAGRPAHIGIGRGRIQYRAAGGIGIAPLRIEAVFGKAARRAGVAGRPPAHLPRIGGARKTGGTPARRVAAGSFIRGPRELRVRHGRRARLVSLLEEPVAER